MQATGNSMAFAIGQGKFVLCKGLGVSAGTLTAGVLTASFVLTQVFIVSVGVYKMCVSDSRIGKLTSETTKCFLNVVFNKSTTKASSFFG